jgi:hypothetical protein
MRDYLKSLLDDCNVFIIARLIHILTNDAQEEANIKVMFIEKVIEDLDEIPIEEKS